MIVSIIVYFTIYFKLLYVSEYGIKGNFTYGPVYLPRKTRRKHEKKGRNEGLFLYRRSIMSHQDRKTTQKQVFHGVRFLHF